MERRAASHTEEEEMNQRRRLLGLARKGDPKAISKLFELYQVRVLNGDMLSKLNKSYYKAAAAQEQKGSIAYKRQNPKSPPMVVQKGGPKPSSAPASPAGKDKKRVSPSPTKKAAARSAGLCRCGRQIPCVRSPPGFLLNAYLKPAPCQLFSNFLSEFSFTCVDRSLAFVIDAPG